MWTPCAADSATDLCGHPLGPEVRWRQPGGGGSTARRGSRRRGGTTAPTRGGRARTDLPCPSARTACTFASAVPPQRPHTARSAFGTGNGVEVAARRTQSWAGVAVSRPVSSLETSGSNRKNDLSAVSSWPKLTVGGRARQVRWPARQQILTRFSTLPGTATDRAWRSRGAGSGSSGCAHRTSR